MLTIGRIPVEPEARKHHRQTAAGLLIAEWVDRAGQVGSPSGAAKNNALVANALGTLWTTVLKHSAAERLEENLCKTASR